MSITGPNRKPNPHALYDMYVEEHWDAAEGLTTRQLPKTPKRGKYIKAIDTHEVIWVDNAPPRVPDPEQAGKDAGRALALEGLPFDLKLVHGIVGQWDTTAYRPRHVFNVVDAGKGGKEVKDYGKVPADFQKWVDTVDAAAKAEYDALNTPEAKFDRWRAAMALKHPDMVEYVDVMFARFKVELLTELTAKEDAEALAEAQAADAKAQATIEPRMVEALPVRTDRVTVIDFDIRDARKRAWDLLPEMHGNHRVWDEFVRARNAEHLDEDAAALRALLDRAKAREAE